MQRVGIVLLSLIGLSSCDGGDEEPLCAPADEILVFEDNDQDGFGRRTIGYRCGLRVGQSTNNVDCRDDDPTVFPGAVEVCDNLDNDCDGTIDEGFNPQDFYVDADGDSFGDPESLVRTCDNLTDGYWMDRSDCDDSREGVSPGAVEICDNDLDDDCNGTIDDRFEVDCQDYKDNDCDGLVDCDDDDCNGVSACRLACTDQVIPVRALPIVFESSTTSFLPDGSSPTNNHEPTCASSNNPAPDVVLQWRVPEDGAYSFSTEGSDFNTVLSLFIGECDLTPNRCNDNGPGLGNLSLIESIDLSEGDVIAILVDGTGFGTVSGDFQVTITKL